MNFYDAYNLRKCIGNVKDTIVNIIITLGNNVDQYSMKESPWKNIP